MGTQMDAQDRGQWGTGWVIFAGCMMMMLGVFQSIAGLTALFNDDFFLVGSSGLIVSLDITAWGWIHLVLGVVIFAAGGAALSGRAWGRVIGIVLALLSAITNLAFLPAYPVWSTIMIVIDILVIYALAVHTEPA